MEEIAVEEKRVTRIEFHVDKLHGFGGFVGALGVGAGLVAVPTVFDAAHLVGALQHLQAAVGAGVGITAMKAEPMSGKSSRFGTSNRSPDANPRRRRGCLMLILLW